MTPFWSPKPLSGFLKNKISFAAAAESAVTVRSIIYCLLTNKPAYSRLVLETRCRKCTFEDSAQDLSFLSVNPCPGRTRRQVFLEAQNDDPPKYSTAVIKESLRLHTSNCPPMERVVPPPGLLAKGYFLPAGTIVSIPYYAAHRNTQVYGPDANVFRPERWLDADPDTLKLMDRSFLAVSRSLLALFVTSFAIRCVWLVKADRKVCEEHNLAKGIAHALGGILVCWNCASSSRKCLAGLISSGQIR